MFAILVGNPVSPDGDKTVKSQKKQPTMVSITSNGKTIMFHSDSLVLTQSMDSTVFLLEQLKEITK